MGPLANSTDLIIIASSLPASPLFSRYEKAERYVSCVGAIRIAARFVYASRTDFGMRGLAISFWTLIRVALTSSFESLLFLHLRCHRDRSNTVPFCTVLAFLVLLLTHRNLCESAQMLFRSPNKLLVVQQNRRRCATAGCFADSTVPWSP
jgi:hypothetical protein